LVLRPDVFFTKVDVLRRLDVFFVKVDVSRRLGVLFTVEVFLVEDARKYCEVVEAILGKRIGTDVGYSAMQL
jgi:hypothetical protein